MREPTRHLVLTYHWFDEIAAGRKKVEYREFGKPGDFCVGDTLVFHRAYTSITLKAKIETMTIVPFSELPESEQSFFWWADKNARYLAIGFKLLPVIPCNSCKGLCMTDNDGWPCSAYWCYSRLRKEAEGRNDSNTLQNEN